MDHHRFDEIAKRFASGPTRRAFLKSCLAATSAFGVALRPRRADGAEVLRGLGQICTKHGNCASGVCGPPDFTGRQKCSCKLGQAICSNICVDPATAFQSDKNNCGACGNRCTGTNVCCKGACVKPETVCNGVCCPGTQVCFENVCCQPGTVDSVCVNKCGVQPDGCGGTVACGACCTAAEGDCELNSDCCSTICIESACAAGPVIDGEACDDDDDCQSGACCENLCVASTAYDDDVNNCGSCGNVCPGESDECTTVTCQAGACGATHTENGTPIADQTPGDCKTAVCDGEGGTTSIPNNDDVPTTTSGQCKVAICVAGSPSESNATSGAECTENGGSYCDGSGNCVECVLDTHCASNSCDDNVCCVAEEESVTCEAGCGEQTNNCLQPVQCGECCPSGQRPSTVGDYCVPDATTCATFTSSVNFANKSYRECDFSSQTISFAACATCDFRGASFSSAALTSINFQFSNLSGAVFTSATMTTMDFRFADLTGANFASSNFVGHQSWTAPNANTICPDTVAINTGTCCSNMNGNNPTTCA